MTKTKAFRRLEEIDREIVILEHINAVLSWDGDAMPRKAGEERGRQMAAIASLIYRKASGNEMGDILSFLQDKEGKNDYEKALFRIRFREWDRQRKLSPDFPARSAEASNRGYMVWKEARAKKDFGLFAPTLADLMALGKEKADAWREKGQSRYDVLLDGFEVGMTTGEYDHMFSAIKPTLVDLVSHASPVDDSFFRKKYAIASQDRLATRIMKEMGFDFSRGLKAVSPHPYTTTLGEDDVRITTRYSDPSVMDSFYSTVHECGHALYEQWASHGRLKGTSIPNGASYAMHESQSRLWENIIGHGKPFLLHCFPLFQKEFPDQLCQVGFDSFYRAANNIRPSFIRTNADEVSYNLHIMLRYEIEKKLFDGEMGVGDVPAAWNALSEELLGLSVPDDSLGCLQDVHWASGDFGYFPTYTLGNLYGAQIWESLNGDLDTKALLEKGDLKPITVWLGERVYRMGMLYEPKDLLVRVTGKGLDACCFTRYLESKYRGIDA